MEKFPYTLVIVIPAIACTFLLGNWIGGRIGFTKSKRNSALYYFFIALQSAPFFWVALVVMYVFQFNTFNGLLPQAILPWRNSGPFEWGNIGNLLLYGTIPFLTMVICFTGKGVTEMRATTINELNSGYVAYAEKLGFRRNSLRKIVHGNAILPQVAVLKLRLTEMASASLVIEYIFNWPGLGATMVQAAQDYDYFVIIGCCLTIIIIVLAGNFFIDIACGVLDPRIRTGTPGIKPPEMDQCSSAAGILTTEEQALVEY